MARTASRSRIIRAPRRQAEWAQTRLLLSQLALTSVQTLGSSTLGISFASRVTIARIRGNVSVVFDPGAAGDHMEVGIGLIVVNTDAYVSSGAPAVPSPTEDFDAPWIWHQTIPLGPSQAAAASDASINGNFRVEIDSKAMRKVGPNETLTFITDGVIYAGAPTYDILCLARVMVLLP